MHHQPALNSGAAEGKVLSLGLREKQKGCESENKSQLSRLSGVKIEREEGTEEGSVSWGDWAVGFLGGPATHGLCALTSFCSPGPLPAALAQ